jgi:hypothetical protein
LLVDLSRNHLKYILVGGLSTRAGIKKNKPNKNNYFCAHNTGKLLHGYLAVDLCGYSSITHDVDCGLF